MFHTETIGFQESPDRSPLSPVSSQKPAVDSQKDLFGRLLRDARNDIIILPYHLSTNVYLNFSLCLCASVAIYFISIPSD